MRGGFYASFPPIPNGTAPGGHKKLFNLIFYML